MIDQSARSRRARVLEDPDRKGIDYVPSVANPRNEAARCWGSPIGRGLRDGGFSVKMFQVSKLCWGVPDRKGLRLLAGRELDQVEVSAGGPDRKGIETSRGGRVVVEVGPLLLYWGVPDRKGIETRRTPAW